MSHLSEKLGNIQDFSNLGGFDDFFLHQYIFEPETLLFVLDKDIQDLIHSAVEARDFSYRYKMIITENSISN